MGFKHNLFVVMVTAIVTLTAFPTVLSIAKLAETTWYPVVSSIEMTKVNRTDDNETIIWGRTNKLRDCAFENLSFYKKTRWGDELVPAERLRPPVNPNGGPVGQNKFGPWKVAVPKEEFDAVVFAKTLHRCHPLYLTESIVYNKGKY